MHGNENNILRAHAADAKPVSKQAFFEEGGPHLLQCALIAHPRDVERGHDRQRCNNTVMLLDGPVVATAI